MKTSAKISRILFRKQYHSVLLLLLLAGVLLALGVWLGENGLVQRNAHYLCLDCIGIG
ncbi:MAG: hypothetical protein P9M08_08310 [Candidatus Erginobacter occultus]|nr:hypothetical protein [Candidatus Erginobacter occultus]